MAANAISIFPPPTIPSCFAHIRTLFRARFCQLSVRNKQTQYSHRSYNSFSPHLMKT
ncbi:hypothetical protein Z947_3230 [Sulfitobacter geojensis]|nr:hypothetical protein Z947_3230 [Sulfitobacter geojensis]